MSAFFGEYFGIYLTAFFCGAVSACFLVLFLLSSRYLSVLQLFRSEWKLGGGLGGVSIPKPVVYAVVALVFGILAALLVSQVATSQFTRESEARKYQDLKEARQLELEKARIAAAKSESPNPDKKTDQPAAPIRSALKTTEK